MQSKFEVFYPVFRDTNEPTYHYHFPKIYLLKRLQTEFRVTLHYRLVYLRFKQYLQVELDSCCLQCPVKFQNRERGIEFCRSRKIIKLLFIQDQVRLRHFLGRTLRLGQARGQALRPRVRLSSDIFWAEHWGQDRLGGRALRPHVFTSCQSLRRHLKGIIFWIYKIQSPSLCFGILRGIAYNRNPTLYLLGGCPFYTAECQD